MKHLRITATSVAAGATLVIASGIAASADDLDPVEQVAQQVSAATEDTSPLVEPSVCGPDLTAESLDGSVQVRLPIGDDDAIVLTDQATGASIAIGFPVDISRDAEVADDGTVVYQAETTKPAVDVAAQILEDGSVRVQTVVDTPAAPHEFACPLTLPAGASLSLTDDGGVIAIDAVATVADQRYPVVADPWLGIALVDKVTRATVSGKGYRYSAYPTWWARAGAGYGARWAAWAEAYTKDKGYWASLAGQCN